MSFNTIVVSSNLDPVYFEFWPVIAKVYKLQFPGVKVHLALLADIEEDDPIAIEARKHGDVTIVKPVPGFHEFGQAKCVRFYVAAMQPSDEVIYIEDIDLISINRDFITSKTDKRPAGHLLCCGREVYGKNAETYPISQLTAEAHLWKKIINPHSQSFARCMWEWSNPFTVYDRRENMNVETDWATDLYSSDERLLRVLTERAGVNHLRFFLPRGYDNYLEETIDRGGWAIDMGKLYAGKYWNCHSLRPYSAYKTEIQPILDYIEKTYS